LLICTCCPEKRPLLRLGGREIDSAGGESDACEEVAPGEESDFAALLGRGLSGGEGERVSYSLAEEEAVGTVRRSMSTEEKGTNTSQGGPAENVHCVLV